MLFKLCVIYRDILNLKLEMGLFRAFRTQGIVKTQKTHSSIPASMWIPSRAGAELFIIYPCYHRLLLEFESVHHLFASTNVEDLILTVDVIFSGDELALVPRACSCESLRTIRGSLGDTACKAHFFLICKAFDHDPVLDFKTI